MPEIVFLEGRQALSTFRLDKLLIEAQNIEYLLFWVMDPFVEESESLKQGGAGAGLTDND